MKLFKLIKKNKSNYRKWIHSGLFSIKKYIATIKLKNIIISCTILILIIVASLIIKDVFFKSYSYDLGSAGSLLTPINLNNGDKIIFNDKNQSFEFNNGQSFSSNENIKTGTSNVSAIIPKDPSIGTTVTDSVNKTNFKLTPNFKLEMGEQNANRIVFPLSNNDGWLVYTIQNTGIKEDIILKKYVGNEKTFNYTLGLEDGLVAKIENDGSIGVYGNSLFSSNIKTATEEDAILLQKARENSEKNILLFTIPKPIIIESNGKKSEVQAKYILNDEKLSLEVSNLKNANYPLSIDPSIYVATAQQFMSGNNETNINFNVEEQLIEKGRTTGARFDSWENTTKLPTSSWGSGNVAAGGFIYSVGGTSFSGKIFNTQGSDSFTVPEGVNSIEVRAWGGGGGGGGGGSSGSGGDGGGGGYTTATISVTPGESLNVYVGGGGNGGSYHSGGYDAGGGGGGGGYSSISRGSTLLSIASGGGGGGGSRYYRAGGDGGAGGGTNGVSGIGVGYANGGNGGTQYSGGSGGTNSSGNDGSSGSYLNGGNGADGRTSDGADGSGANGGLNSGGNGGQPNINTTRAGGGGGGSGYYGGGGGAATRSNNTDSGAGGGGGSSYVVPGATNISILSGSGINPGNYNDPYRNGAGTGGSGGSSRSDGNPGSNGLVMITYGVGTTVSKSLNWAKFNTTDGTVESANPGSGVCSGWCTTASYDLPVERTNFSLVAYNGFLYAMGGKDSSGTRHNTVFIAKLGANGEPQLWHPTNSDKTSWSYWYQDTGLSSIRSDFTAVAYNNKMYVIGGLSANGAVNSVQYTDITATGKLGNWVSGTNLPFSIYGHSSQVYNDRLYIIGGSNSIGGPPLNSVFYNVLNENGSTNNWIQTTSFSDGRIGNGGNFSVVWGAYIYISGGCNTVNASGYCTNVLSDTQVASINADGSIDSWNTVGNVANQRMGFGMVAWRDRIYEIGGCSSQNTSTGDCNTAMLDSIIYGKINQDGDASTVAQSVANGTYPCSGPNPYGCNLPGTSYIGNMLSVTVIANGYLYIIGGCTNDYCSSTSGNVAYVAISSTGQISQPATCPSGTYQGSIWCVDTTNVIPGGIAASSPVVFGGRLYLVGGLDGSSNKNMLYRTTLSSDGSISPWIGQTLTGIGATSVSYNYAYARANPESASTNPGNLYIFGGCTNSTAAGCTTYAQEVYKCNIQTTGAIANCSTNGQQQIGVIPGGTGTGLGIMSGTVYANYIYLIGGVGPGLVDLNTVRYAKFDNNNNVVAVSGNSWIESPSKMVVGRRRADAFGYNGYIYVVGGYDATAGVLADIEFVKVNVSDGSLGTADDNFHVSSVTINQRWGLSVPVSNSYAYVIGGCTAGDSPGGCSSRTDVIQTFQIYNNDSGAPSGFYPSANTYTTEPNRVGASSVILNGYIYTAGGCVSATDCTITTNDVSYAPIDVNGNIGSWSSASAGLPAGRTWGELETAGGSLYYIGGQSNNATDERAEVFYTTPSSSGNITSWSTASNGLPNGRTKFGSTVWNNRIYVVGGLNTSATDTATIYVSPQLNNGGNITSAWSTSSTNFNVSRSNLSAIAYANNLYIFGGYDGANYLSDVQYSKIDPSTGNAGSWTYTTSLGSPLADADGFAANGYIYLMGGKTSSSTCAPTTMVAPVSANTTIALGNNPTGVGAWYETNQRYSGSRYGASALYFDGKAYIIGGADCQMSANQQIFDTQGTSTYTVPAGVTNVTVKAWGGGGGGGGGSTYGSGGDGGGGGFTQTTLSVTPGETLNINVGGGGGAGDFSSGNYGDYSGDGGGGGGYSQVLRGSTPLAIAAGGGGGGGGDNSSYSSGGQGGAGGGNTGVSGGYSGSSAGGDGGTQTYGGSGGSSTNNGSAGYYLNGGDGGDGLGNQGSDGSKNNGATPGGADGGNGDQNASGYAGGGGGGGGYYGGGGGGGAAPADAGGGGGGGGSSYVTGTNILNIAGSNFLPGNYSDADRNNAGQGGVGGSSYSNGSQGSTGAVIISHGTPSLNYATPVIQQTTLLSQPMVAKYSTMIDTDSDVFPSYWLLNGVDNSIGASWQLSYRSMTDLTTLCTSPAMTTWGSNTNFGNVTLGLPGIYTPKNGSGIDTDCARFYNFLVTVDSSQAFGYPDDVSRGPTITDLTLQFTADPSKRLMHGRTFTGGLQQPLDTPYYSY